MQIDLLKKTTTTRTLVRSSDPSLIITGPPVDRSRRSLMIDLPRSTLLTTSRTRCARRSADAELLECIDAIQQGLPLLRGPAPCMPNCSDAVCRSP